MLSATALLLALQAAHVLAIRTIQSQEVLAEDLPSDIASKFQRAELLVHMKRDFSRLESQLRRWQSNGHIDYSLSYSLIGSQLAMEQLWVKSGYFFDGTKCEALAASNADLWVNNEVQHGSQNILTTPGGRRAELLRLLWLRKSLMHVVLPPGFREWAKQPEDWTQQEKEVFTANNPFSKDDTIKEVPTKEELATLIDSLSSTSVPARVASDFLDAAQGVAKDYNTFVVGVTHPREKFTEVLALCPLEALLGFVYSVQGFSLQGIEPDEGFRAKMKSEGERVLAAIRAELPSLAKQPLAIVEYKPISLDLKELSHPSSEEEIAAAKESGLPITLRWKTGAQLQVVKVEEGQGA